ncbi:MAG TPA: VWA domain-containing protein [Candidatus Sulfotelmatobacter sp.]|nr:VWA domain-containing protein [Candidatus Sulfotelmatobacter sp.]
MPRFPVPVSGILPALTLAALFSVAQLGLAQQSTAQPPTAQQPAPDQKAGDAQQPAETIKTSVNVVQLFFNVKDKHGALIPGLTKDDFEVYEDGKLQTVKYFTAETNLPLTLGIMIDASGSQLRVLDMEKQAGGAFVKQVLTDKDEAYVISFDITVDLLQDFTRDVRRLQNALNKVKISSDFTSGIPGLGGGPVPQHNSPGTLLFDAVYLSAHDMLAKEIGRKAMILLTDGQDEGSRLKLKDAVEAAQKADAIVYVLLCADRGSYFSSGMAYYGEADMKKLTEQTGGRVINVGNKFDKLKEAFDQIAAELRSQYNVGYTPLNTSLDGSFRKLEIKNKQSYKIQARAGYYAGHQD